MPEAYFARLAAMDDAGERIHALVVRLIEERDEGQALAKVAARGEAAIKAEAFEEAAKVAEVEYAAAKRFRDNCAPGKPSYQCESARMLSAETIATSIRALAKAGNAEEDGA